MKSVAVCRWCDERTGGEKDIGLACRISGRTTGYSMHAFILKMVIQFNPPVKSEEALWESVCNFVDCRQTFAYGNTWPATSKAWSRVNFLAATLLQVQTFKSSHAELQDTSWSWRQVFRNIWLACLKSEDRSYLLSLGRSPPTVLSHDHACTSALCCPAWKIEGAQNQDIFPRQDMVLATHNQPQITSFSLFHKQTMATVRWQCHCPIFRHLHNTSTSRWHCMIPPIVTEQSIWSVPSLWVSALVAKFLMHA